MARALTTYWKTAAMTATAAGGEGLPAFANYLLRLVRIVLLLSLWRMVFDGRGVESGMTLAAVLTYTLVAEAFVDPLNCRSNLFDDLWNGSIAVKLTQPVSMFGQIIAETVGRWALGLAIVSLPLLLIAPLLGVDPRPATPAAGLLFLISLTLAIVVGFAIEFLFGALVFLVDLGIWAIASVRNALTVVLSGALIPLALLPWGLGPVLSLSPFGAMASAPLRIYTDTGPAFELIALQLFWAILLWPVAIWVWRSSRERVVVYGG